jgi:hypothetical protein
VLTSVIIGFRVLLFLLFTLLLLLSTILSAVQRCGSFHVSLLWCDRQVTLLVVAPWSGVYYYPHLIHPIYELGFQNANYQTACLMPCRRTPQLNHRLGYHKGIFRLSLFEIFGLYIQHITYVNESVSLLELCGKCSCKQCTKYKE